ncbi:MAG: hypothetical protein ACLFUV_00185 [Methanomassiliicoccales archaeon]
MQIKGFEASSIEAKRFTQSGEKSKNVRVDQNSSVTEINRLDNETAQVAFRFLINYSNRGFIKIEGKVTVVGEIDPLMEEWGKTNSMPVDTANLVHNVVVSNALPIALLVSRDVKLPPPMPLPKLNLKKKDQTSASSGVEVA